MPVMNPGLSLPAVMGGCCVSAGNQRRVGAWLWWRLMPRMWLLIAPRSLAPMAPCSWRCRHRLVGPQWMCLWPAT